MRESLVILCVSIFLLSCKKEEDTPAVEVIQPRSEDVAAIKDILDGAAAKQRNTPPTKSVGRAALESHAVFKEFWNPKMIKRYGRHEWDTELYADAKYVIAQRSLEVATRRDDTWPIDELQYSYRARDRRKDDWDVETIADFSPVVSIPDTIVVSLTRELSDELQGFLGGDFTEATTPDIMSPAQAREESRMKLVAADTMVRFYSKHWGDGWHLISHPEVEQILFDREYLHALVSFRIVYQGGYAFYDKTPDGWKLAKSTIDWIE
jgi:hypothetical protein